MTVRSPWRSPGRWVSYLVAGNKTGSKMKLGLCTYQWGQEWTLPTVLANCEKAGVFGVELPVNANMA